MLMGRSFLIRDRELLSSCGNLLGRVGDCSGSLKSVWRLSGFATRRGISSKGCFVLGFFVFWVFRLYTTPLFVTLFLSVSVRLVQRPD
jgi:hypothetical protein